MRKRISLLIVMCILCSQGLIGCGKEDIISSTVATYIEDKVSKASNIEADDDYKRYEELSESVNIVGGYCVSDEIATENLDDPDAIHVTFAKNSYITIKYYDDPGLTHELNPDGAYLHVNDSIYEASGMMVGRFLSGLHGEDGVIA